VPDFTAGVPPGNAKQGSAMSGASNGRLDDDLRHREIYGARTGVILECVK